MFHWILARHLPVLRDMPLTGPSHVSSQSSTTITKPPDAPLVQPQEPIKSPPPLEQQHQIVDELGTGQHQSVVTPETVELARDIESITDCPHAMPHDSQVHELVNSMQQLEHVVESGTVALDQSLVDPLKGDLDQIPNGLEGAFTRALKNTHESENVTTELRALLAKLSLTGSMPSEEDLQKLNDMCGGDIKVTTTQGKENLKQLIEGALDTIMRDDHAFLERISGGQLPSLENLTRLNVLIEGDKSKEFLGKMQEQLTSNPSYDATGGERLALKGLIDIARARTEEGITEVHLSTLDFDYASLRSGGDGDWSKRFEKLTEQMMRLEERVEKHGSDVTNALAGGLDKLDEKLNELGIHDTGLQEAIQSVKFAGGELEAFRVKMEDVRESATGSRDLPTEKERIRGEKLEQDTITGFAVMTMGPNGVSARGRLTVNNLNDSGVNLNIMGGVSIRDRVEYLNDGRVLQVASISADLSIGASGVVESASLVSGSIEVGGGYSIAYARNLKDGETRLDASVLGGQLPPRRSELAKNPTVLEVGDEIHYRGNARIGVTVGAVEPNSGVKFSVGASYERDFLTSVKRLEGEPPKFRLHVEPANSTVDAHGAVGWGPFAITGGGGYASTVFYEFDMTEEKLKQFLKDGKMPEIPDPSRYLRQGQVLTEDTFKPFTDIHGENGITLVNMGATRATNKYLEGSMTVAKARTTSENTRTVVIRDGEVVRQDVHSMEASTSAWGKGKKSKSLSLMQSDRYQRVGDNHDLQRNYEGLQATFKFSSTKTKTKDLQQEVDKANSFLHPGTQLELPDLSSFGSSSMAIQANLTPAVLEKLTNLDLATQSSTVQWISDNLGVKKEDLEQLVKDLKGTGSQIGLSVDEVARQRGACVAKFLEGTTSIVTDGELKRIAALDRLVGGGLADITVISTVHKKRIEALNVHSYLSTDMLHLAWQAPSDPWKHLSASAQKLHELEDIRVQVAQDSLLDPSEKATLMMNIDLQADLLNADLNKLLQDPESRGKIMPELLKAGGLFSGVSDKLNEYFKDPDSGLGIYSDGEGIFDDPAVKGMFLDRVIGMALTHGIQGSGGQDPTEMAGYITAIIDKGSGGDGTDQVFKILAKAKEAGVDRSLVGQLDGDKLAKLVPRLTEEQRGELVAILGELDEGKMGKVQKAAVKARKEAHKEYSAIHSDLTDLSNTLTRLDDTLPTITKDDKLLENRKDVHKKVGRGLHELTRTITQKSLVMGSVLSSQLNEHASVLSVRVNESMEHIGELNPKQRAGLFGATIGQRNLGEASHDILKRLIATSDSGKELSRMAQDLERKANRESGQARLDLMDRVMDCRSRIQQLDEVALASN